MKVLITGSAGFIGSFVAKKLLERGDFVVGVDNFNDYYSPRMKEHHIESFKNNPNFKLYREDITNYEALKEIFENEKPERIIHTAARAGVRPSIENPFIYEETNVRGTLNLLELSKDFEIENFVLVSSSSVYGNTNKIPFSEEDSVDKPVSPYAATKKATELLGHVYHHVYGLSVNVVRPFTVYGPAGRPDMVPILFPSWIDKGQEIKKFGDGTSKRDYTYVEDIADGMISALDRIFGYEIFNLGNSDTVELNRFIEIVEKNMGKKAVIKEYPMPAGDVNLTYADISKARKMLDYNPKMKIEEGMKIVIDWYKENKHLYD
ncbi:MAG: GDP-mannose 4,6-dehydratase [Patescibacteria group bacterium]